MPRVRITGIVREAEALRRALASPLSRDRLAELSRGVAESLRQINAILAQHKADVRSLPQPSRQAYQFLRDFDPSRVTTAAVEHAAAAPRYRRPESIGFRGLRSFLDRVLDDLALSVHGGRSDSDAMLRVVRQTAQRLDGMIERKGFAPSDIRPESRQCTGWFRYFSDPDAFAAYREALQRAKNAFDPLPFGGRGWRLPLLVHFRPSAHLYRCRPMPDGTRVLLAVPMITFEAETFSHLGRRMLGAKGHRCAVTDAMMADEYQALSIELENAAGVVELMRGAAYDLGECFSRVNREYFSEALSRPKLSWTRRLTGRVFGHYDFVHDQLCISSTLDRADVPRFVVDHVMHHELLHKKHGYRWQGHRRHAHTPEFRQEERTFREFEQADRYLNQLSAALR